MNTIFNLTHRAEYLKYTLPRRMVEKFCRNEGVGLPQMKLMTFRETKAKYQIETSFIDYSKRMIVIAIDENWDAKKQWTWATMVTVHECAHDMFDFDKRILGIKTMVESDLMNVLRDCKNEQQVLLEDRWMGTLLKRGRKIVFDELLADYKTPATNAFLYNEARNLILTAHTVCMAKYTKVLKLLHQGKIDSKALWLEIEKEGFIPSPELRPLWTAEAFPLVARMWCERNNWILRELMDEFMAMFPAPRNFQEPESIADIGGHRGHAPEKATDGKDAREGKPQKSEKTDQSDKSGGGEKSPDRKGSERQESSGSEAKDGADDGSQSEKSPAQEDKSNGAAPKSENSKPAGADNENSENENSESGHGDQKNDTQETGGSDEKDGKSGGENADSDEDSSGGAGEDTAQDEDKSEEPANDEGAGADDESDAAQAGDDSESGDENESGGGGNDGDDPKSEDAGNSGKSSGDEGKDDESDGKAEKAGGSDSAGSDDGGEQPADSDRSDGAQDDSKPMPKSGDNDSGSPDKSIDGKSPGKSADNSQDRNPADHGSNSDPAEKAGETPKNEADGESNSDQPAEEPISYAPIVSDAKYPAMERDEADLDAEEDAEMMESQIMEELDDANREAGSFIEGMFPSAGEDTIHPSSPSSWIQVATPYVPSLARELKVTLQPRVNEETNLGRLNVARIIRFPDADNPFDSRHSLETDAGRGRKLTVVCDTSGSMKTGGKIVAAKVALMTAHLTCRQVEMEYQILTSRTLCVLASSEMSEARCLGLVAGLAQHTMGDNYLATLPALLAKLKQSQKTEDQIVIVITDGQPGGVETLAEIVNKSRDEGFLIVGLGLNLSEVERRGMETIFGQEFCIHGQVGSNIEGGSFAEVLGQTLTRLVRMSQLR